MKSIFNRSIWIFVAVFLISLTFADLGHAGLKELDLSSAAGIWLFDDGSGDTAEDMSDQKNHGTLVNSPKWVSGKFGKALEFNGTDNFVKTDKKLLDARVEFTILCWIKPGNLTANRIGLVGQNDSPEFGFSNPTTLMIWTPCSNVEAAYEYPADEWHHLAVVSTGASLAMYYDGVEAGKVDADCADGHGSSDFGVNIGGGGIWDADGNWFTGAMDEVAIFHSALTGAQINDVMKSGFVAMTTAVDPKNRLALTWAQIRKQ